MNSNLPVVQPPVMTGARAATDENVRLFTSVIAPGAPAELVSLVWHYARALDLDPLRREVMLISIPRWDARKNGFVDEYAVIVNIHGMLKTVGRQADYAGLQSGVVYPGERCIIKADQTVEHEFDAGARQPGSALPLGAYASITRVIHGKERRFTSWVPFAQVAQTTKRAKMANGRKVGEELVLRATWKKLPDWMVEKCAIAFTSRKAYDHVFGRVYAPEEFGLLSSDGGIVVPQGSLVERAAGAPPPSVGAGLLAPASGLWSGLAGDDEGAESPETPETVPAGAGEGETASLGAHAAPNGGAPGHGAGPGGAPAGAPPLDAKLTAARFEGEPGRGLTDREAIVSAAAAFDLLFESLPAGADRRTALSFVGEDDAYVTDGELLDLLRAPMPVPLSELNDAQRAALHGFIRGIIARTEAERGN